MCAVATGWSPSVDAPASDAARRPKEYSPPVHPRLDPPQLGEAVPSNSLARAVFIHRLGEIRDRTYENQQHRASGLNFVVTAIILWNTRYLERAVATLRLTEEVPDKLLAYLSPFGWEHVNLTGDYVWVTDQSAAPTNDEMRPLRTPPTPFPKAA